MRCLNFGGSLNFWGAETVPPTHASAVKLIFRLIPGTRKSDFGYPIHHWHVNSTYIFYTNKNINKRLYGLFWSSDPKRLYINCAARRCRALPSAAAAPKCCWEEKFNFYELFAISHYYISISEHCIALRNAAGRFLSAAEHCSITTA